MSHTRLAAIALPFAALFLTGCPVTEGPCLYDGKSHEPGTSFPSVDGCNTCTCTETGVACTLIACGPGPAKDAGAAPDTAAADSGSPANVCTYGGKTYPQGGTFPSTDGCNTCTCTGDGVACTRRACVDAAPPVTGGCVRSGCSGHVCAETQVVTTCEFRPEYACYQKATCERQPDGKCGFTPSPELTRCLGGGADAGAADVRPAPSDVAPSKCDFGTRYDYGLIGGLRIYTERSYLAPGNAYSHARNPVRSDMPTLSCAPPMPACGTRGVITAAEVEAALAHPDVVAALAQPKPPLYGRDTRPVDGVVFELVRRSDARSFLVGTGCAVGSPISSCPPIPKGIAQIRELLTKLDDQQLAAPECVKAGFGR